MIDIHCHMLYGVDDGAKTLEESVLMLKDAKKQGVDEIILTPHYRHGMFPYRVERIVENYKTLCKEAKKIGIKLHLGTEYHVNSRIVEYLDKKRCMPLGHTKYVLTEYDYETDYGYIYNMSRELMANGYIPVVAHVERYKCMTDDLGHAAELREMGAFIQINADAVLGYDGRQLKRYCKELLNASLVDVIASDSHGIKKRVSHMAKCHKHISKKYGEEYADMLLNDNPARIIADE